MNVMNPIALTDVDVEHAIRAIATAAGRNEKEERLAELAAMQEGKRIIDWCYNAFITFGVTWKKEPVYRDDSMVENWNQLPIVHNLLTSLASRELTGSAAREAVQTAFDSLNPSAAKILWLCLNKDLKAGVAEASIKTIDPNLIPIFAVMRAHAYEERLIKKFPVAGEPKLDGNRVSFIARDGSGGFFTRTGKVIASLDPMVPVVLGAVKDWFASSNGFGMELTSVNGVPNIMLDGEMMSDAGFDAVNGALNAKDDRTEGLSYHIFDCLTWEEFDAMGEVRVAYADRRKRVNSIVVHASGMGLAQTIRQTPIEILHSHEEIQEAYQRWRQAGQEGLMVKDPAGFYEKKKSRSWQKLKAEDTEDLPVIGVFQGQAGGKYENTIGGLIVDRNGVEVRVSGIDDATRADIWKLWFDTCVMIGQAPNVGYEGVSFKRYPNEAPGPLLGRLIEVEYHEATKDGSLRHPRFIRFRDDKTGEVDK